MTSQRRLTQLFCLLVLILPVNALAQQPRGRATAPAKPPASDFKITEKTTNSGQTFESTTLIKGARQRSEMHMGQGQDMISLMQCDLKRTIQINDKTRTYMITPMSGGDSSGNETSTTNDARPAPGGGVTSGGIVTYITNTVDTGERKEMFGLTARHLRSTFSIEPSPDACMKDKMRIERDGWYVDLQYGLTCAVDGAAAMGRPTMPGGCRDQVRYKNTGTAKLGFPLSETTTIYGGNGMQMSSSTKEVLELSRQPQEAALFDLPSGYTEAHSFQEMYMPANEAGTASGVVPRPRNQGPSTSVANIARPGVRVGVVALNNKTGKSVSDESLRDRLIAQIIGGNVDAIRLNASSQSEAEAEAKAKKCDYILYTDISALKTASAGKKLGGMFGRAAGVTTSDMGKTEVKLDFKLFPTGSSAPSLSSSASGKEDGEEASMGAAIEREAQAVSAAVRRN
jgi:hypothetical protein